MKSRRGTSGNRGQGGSGRDGGKEEGSDTCHLVHPNDVVELVEVALLRHGQKGQQRLKKERQREANEPEVAYTAS
jgi:Zn-finger protein